MAREDFLTALQNRVLIGDGAYGTLLSRRGLLAGGNIGPVLNVTKPAFVKAAHDEYIAAGADVLETNTFGADPQSLNVADFGDRCHDVCRAGAELARESAGENRWVLGAVGPLFRTSQKLSTDQKAENIAQQIRGLAEGGVDAIQFETFADLHDLLFAIEICRKETDLPILGQMAFTLAGVTGAGVKPERMVKELESRVDVIGVNCGGGESAAIRMTQALVQLTGKPLAVFPNRGLADFDDHGRPVYIEGPDYFARSGRRIADLGANLVGGCCGTSPDDVRALARELHARKPSIRRPRVSSASSRLRVPATVSVQPTLETDLQQRKIVIAEIDPPRGVDASRELAGAKQLTEAGVDAITIADNPLSVMRMSNLALANIFMRELDTRIVLHVACRDRSLIGTQSHLLGAYAMGISNLLAVTGDPVATQAYKGSSGVFDMASHKLIAMISDFNQGEYPSEDGSKTGFFTGAAFNCATLKLENEVKRLERKIQAGARFVMTQPVYDAKRAHEVCDAIAPLGVPVVLGVMPLVSERNAEFLHHEVPGINVPDAIRERMTGKKGKTGRAEGAAISRELMAEVQSHVAGYYMITPMNRYEIIADLTRFARELAGASAR